VSVAQEHFATNFLHARLLAFARGWDRGLGPRAVLACAAGEQHTFGLIAFGVALHHFGWRITYLGANTSVAMIEEAATHVEPEVVVVAAALAERLVPIVDDLRALGERWPTEIAGAGASAALAARAGVQHLDSDPVAGAESVSLRGAAPPAGAT
jgi:methanogenic corrinoid protein MtbC1